MDKRTKEYKNLKEQYKYQYGLFTTSDNRSVAYSTALNFCSAVELTLQATGNKSAIKDFRA
jgi:hypothetical protein